MKNIRLAFIALSSIVLTPATVTAQAFNDTTLLLLPFSDTFVACNGESVPVNGTLQLVLHFTANDNGSSDFSMNNYFAEGVGETTGTKYLLVRHAGLTEYFGNGLGPATLTFVDRARLIGRGNVPDTLIKFTFHFTANANGDLVVLRFESSSECSN